MDHVAIDGREYEFEDAGQGWLASWVPPGGSVPEGTRHGSGAVCRISDERIVLISQDGLTWDHPAGRPENHENWRGTLDREVLEEACAVVESAELLGFVKGRCVQGKEASLVLVRALWSANVRLQEWQPKHEIKHRKLVDNNQVPEFLSHPSGLDPIFNRWLAESLKT